MFKTTKTGYRYNKEMFILWFLISIIILGTYYFMTPADERSGAFFNCTFVTGCRNALYWEHNGGECNVYKITDKFIIYQSPACSPKYAWLSQEWLKQGVYGEQQPRTAEILLLYMLLMLVVVFIINHFAYNRGKPFDIEIVIWKDSVINFQDILKKGGDK